MATVQNRKILGIPTDNKQNSPAKKPTLVIQPTSGWGTLKLGELWQYRDLLWVLTVRDIKIRYRQMALGPLWIIIIPLVNMVIFSLIFGRLAKLPSDGIPYPIFTYVALVPWTYFSNATTDSVGSLLKSIHLISKIYFPRLIVPVSAVCSGLVDFAISFVVLLGVMLFYGFVPSVNILFLPGYIILAMMTALAVGLWNTNLAVRFRDLQFAATYGLRVWMFLTPVAYSAKLVPEQWQLLYQLNPMYWVVEGFRWSLLGRGQPPRQIMIVPIMMVIFLAISGIFIFRRTERTIVDIQ